MKISRYIKLFLSIAVLFMCSGCSNMTDQYSDDPVTGGHSAGDQQVFTADGVSFVMIYVPGGLSFKTGVDDNGDIDGDGDQDILPVASVAHAYWIAETEVTYQLWKKVYDWATSSDRGTCRYTFANAGQMGASSSATEKHPVVTVNWRDIIVWCNALTELYNAQAGTDYTCVYYSDASYITPLRVSTNSTTVTYTTPGTQDFPYIKASVQSNTGMDSCIATGFRLVTGNEWELAARFRGGDNSHGAYEYPAGSGYWWSPGRYASGATAPYTDSTATCLVAWYSVNYTTGSHEVKQRNPNSLGLYDICGNTMEYCFEWHPLNTGIYRLKHGGFFNGAVSLVQTGYAYCNTKPNSQAGGTNFRFGRTE